MQHTEDPEDTELTHWTEGGGALRGMLAEELHTNK